MPWIAIFLCQFGQVLNNTELVHTTFPFMTSWNPIMFLFFSIFQFGFFSLYTSLFHQKQQIVNNFGNFFPLSEIAIIFSFWRLIMTKIIRKLFNKLVCQNIYHQVHLPIRVKWTFCESLGERYVLESDYKQMWCQMERGNSLGRK